MDFISRIPEELFCEILSQVPLDDPPGDIKTCCLVNKRFNASASRILYRHISLTCYIGSGISGHVETALCRPGHQSIRYVREITIRTCRAVVDTSINSTFYPFGKHALQKKVVMESTALLSRLARIVGEDKIKSIHLDFDGFLEHLSLPLRKKVKSLGIPVLAYEVGLPSTHPLSGTEYARPVEKIEMFTRDSELEALNIEMVRSDFGNMASAWKVCQANYKTLKSLHLTGRKTAVPKGTSLIGNGTLDGPRKLEALESLKFELLDWNNWRRPPLYFNITPFLEEFSSTCGTKTIKKFGLLNCAPSHQLDVSWVSHMINLTELEIRKEGPLSGLTELLSNLPHGLSLLYITWVSTRDPDPFPGKSAFEKHSMTLRKLFLDKRQQDELCFEIPVVADECTDALDLKTISRFPLLTHLGIALNKPRSWNSWAPKFGSLKSFFLLNPDTFLPPINLPKSWRSAVSIGYYESRDEALPGRRSGPFAYIYEEDAEAELTDDIIALANKWLDWLASPYKNPPLFGNEPTTMSLQTVIMPVRGYRHKSMRRYRAYLQDSLDPLSFDGRPQKITVLNDWLQETWEFYATNVGETTSSDPTAIYA
ncbi:hypothetical protein TWF481_003223 [Arthrobotrys musiformis]|uniref:F-box domain-containing protein n=1 Tax=Arthrobotrys musiformis TaxID=47236 RepID=A0AAV9VQU6_9PEZI